MTKTYKVPRNLKDAAWPEGYVIGSNAWHFCANLYRRYGIILRPGEYSKIIAQIKQERATLLDTSTRQGTNFPTYLVRLNRRERLKNRQRRIVVVYDGQDLVTALSLDPKWRSRYKKAIRNQQSI